MGFHAIAVAAVSPSADTPGWELQLDIVLGVIGLSARWGGYKSDLLKPFFFREAIGWLPAGLPAGVRRFLELAVFVLFGLFVGRVSGPTTRAQALAAGFGFTGMFSVVDKSSSGRRTAGSQAMPKGSPV